MLGLVLAGINAPLLKAQSSPVAVWEPRIITPMYPPEKGPVIVVDEAHFNFHTIEGRLLLN